MVNESRRQRSNFSSREICKLCYHVNAVGFKVPDSTWRSVVPGRFWDDIVCLSCFTRLGDEKGVPWDERIEFFPVSLETHRRDANGQEMFDYAE